MKAINYLSVFFILLVIGCTSNDKTALVSEPGTITNARQINGHNCKCTSTLGGTSEAKCSNSQNCLCSSGFFSCECHCENAHDTSMPVIDPGPQDTWLFAQEILLQFDNEIAQDIANSMMQVYELYETNPEEFLIQSAELNELFNLLPEEIQELLLNEIN